jgi:hypothetical protein
MITSLRYQKLFVTSVHNERVLQAENKSVVNATPRLCVFDILGHPKLKGSYIQ